MGCWFGVLLGAALASTGLVTPEGSEIAFDDDVAPLVEDALGALKSGDFERAAQQFGDLAEAGNEPELRYLEALSRYEAGDLRLSERASRKGLEGDERHGPLLVLRALVLADLGRGDEGLALLTTAQAVGAKDADHALLARAALNEGLIRLDRGEPSSALAAYGRALEEARVAGDAHLVSLAEDGRRAVEALTGASEHGDPVGRVSDRLRAGDYESARASVERIDVRSRRGLARRGIATGLILRAEGSLDGAVLSLQRAHAVAREGGLIRESAAALAQLGLVYGLGGRHRVALDKLMEAVGIVRGGSLVLSEITYRAQAGRAAITLGDVGAAREQLQAAHARLSEAEGTVARARVFELEARIASHEGELAAALGALESAESLWQARGATVDAARVATDRVSVLAGRADETALEDAMARARVLWDQAGDARGPAHVQVALGLGLGQREQRELALAAFVRAANLADRLESEGGRSIAIVARSNAAEVLAALGHDPALAAQYGLEDALQRHGVFALAEAAYDRGVQAHREGRYADAEVHFTEAQRGFSTLQEHAFAQSSERGRAWAVYNQAVAEVEGARGRFEEAARASIRVGDTELNVRARAAVAILRASDADDIDRFTRLKVVAADAERIGLPRVAGRCWAEVADIETVLHKRAYAARQAYDFLDSDPIAVYAMYSVAVDAYNAGSLELAGILSGQILESAGDLTEEVRAVYEASTVE